MFPFPTPVTPVRHLPSPRRWSPTRWTQHQIPAAGGVIVVVDVFAAGHAQPASPELNQASDRLTAGLAIRALLNVETGAPCADHDLTLVWGRSLAPPDESGEPVPVVGALLFGCDAESFKPRLVAVVSAMGHATPPMSWCALVAPAGNHNQIRAMSPDPRTLKPAEIELSDQAARLGRAA